MKKFNPKKLNAKKLKRRKLTPRACLVKVRREETRLGDLQTLRA